MFPFNQLLHTPLKMNVQEIPSVKNVNNYVFLMRQSVLAVALVFQDSSYIAMKSLVKKLKVKEKFQVPLDALVMIGLESEVTVIKPVKKF